MKFVFYEFFDKWKSIFYSRAAQLERLHPLPHKLNKLFPNLIDVKNKFLREHIKQVRKEITLMSNAQVFLWRSCMQLAFKIFFSKKYTNKLIFMYLCIMFLIVTFIYTFCIIKLINYLSLYNNAIDLIIILLWSGFKLIGV